MAQKTDLYSILSSYVVKHNNPYIKTEPFVRLLQHHANRNALTSPEWNKWIHNTRVRFNTEFAALVQEGKFELFSEAPDETIYMPGYILDLLDEYYSNIDNNADNFFPGEETYGFTIPEKQIRQAGSGSGLAALMDESIEIREPIIRIGFPDDTRTALVPAVCFPDRLMEASLLKIRNYLRDYGNKDYINNKLISQLMGKESALRDMLNRVILRPMDCCRTLRESGDFPYLFWAHFCMFVKSDFRKKKEKANIDVAVMQAVNIIEGMNVFYKNKAAKAKEKELALKSLEQSLSKPPYLYTLEQIIKFTNMKGNLLLGLYSREDLANHIKKLTNDSKEDKLPELLVLNGPKKELYFIMKSRMLMLSTRLVIETKDKIKREISKHWLRMLKNYRSEPAMENDRDFEKALYQYTAKLAPVLNCLLEDPKFQLVYDELDQIHEIPPSSKIFVKGSLIPYSTLYLINRKDLLDDTRLFLPFWYSLPVFISVVAFFKDLFRRNSGTEDSTADENLNIKEGNRDMPNAARMIEYSMVPGDHTIDSYLEELKAGWTRLLSKQARDNLTEDVNALIRDNLRQTLRINKPFKVTRENIIQLAMHILNTTPSLQRLPGQDSLNTYIEIYLVKLLETVKF